MSDFYDKVYEVVRLIPAGKVTSYGAIASFLGTAQSSRMVGWAMNNAGSQEKYVPAPPGCQPKRIAHREASFRLVNRYAGIARG